MLVQRQTVPIYHVAPDSYNKQLLPSSYNFSSYYQHFSPNVAKMEFSFYPDAHYDENSQYIKGDYYDFHYTVDGTLKMHLLLVLVGTLLILLLYL